MKNSLLTVIGGASTALAAIKGFNYGAQGGSQAKFESDFKTAASLKGADGFNSARLYTMIQEGTTNSPVEAIAAAIDTKTTLLLGLWASVDQTAFNNELAALKSAIDQYGSSFTDLVVGISCGSEDLYRISPMGIEKQSGIGQTPDVLVNYIGQVRNAIQGTPLSNVPVGHVDTWNAFVNGSNSAVISACDFLGLDEYPYWQTTEHNGIDNAYHLFFEAYDKVQEVAPGKQLWVTEAGWPTSGPQSGEAVASVDNAETYWQEVACELENRDINFWWYILADAGASPSFGVSDGNGSPLYNLACNSTSNYNSTSSSSNSASSWNPTSSSNPSRTTTGLTASATGSSSYPTNASGSASGTAGAPIASISHYTSAASNVQNGVAALLIAAFTAALL